MTQEHGRKVTVDPAALRADPVAWLATQMSEEMPWLLAHADDGVIWGKRERDGTVELSSSVFNDSDAFPSVAVALRWLTLQEMRIFGPGGELHVWKSSDGFEAWLVTDEEVRLETLPLEPYLLWHQGSPVRIDEPSGFSLLQEGAQGQRHAPPVIPHRNRRPALLVRHYVDYDLERQAHIKLSRLFDLTNGEEVVDEPQA